MRSITMEEVAELRAAGLHELYRIRRQAMDRVAEEIQAALQAAQEQAPQDAPSPAPWCLSLASLVPLQAHLQEPHNWHLLSAHLAARTAMHMAGEDLGNGITGYSLAAHVGADLHALALDGWERLAPLGLSLASKGAAHV